MSSLWLTHHIWPHNLTKRTPCFCKHFTICSTPVNQDQMPHLTLICQHKLDPHKEKISSFSRSSYYLSTVTLTVTQPNEELSFIKGCTYKHRDLWNLKLILWKSVNYPQSPPQHSESPSGLRVDLTFMEALKQNSLGTGRICHQNPGSQRMPGSILWSPTKKNPKCKKHKLRRLGYLICSRCSPLFPWQHWQETNGTCFLRYVPTSVNMKCFFTCQRTASQPEFRKSALTLQRWKAN